MLIRTYVTLAYAIKQLKRARRRIKRMNKASAIKKVFRKNYVLY